MSTEFLILSMLMIICNLGLLTLVIPSFRRSLEAPFNWKKYLDFYRLQLHGLKKKRTKENLLIYFHYLSFHLFTPLIGFSLFLRTDGNFLVVLFSFFVSYQLHHRFQEKVSNESA